MKLVITLPIILSSPFSINGASIRGLRTNESHVRNDVVNIQECSSKAILPLIKGNPHFSEALADLDSAEKAIDELCHNHHRTLQVTDEIPFSHVN